MKEYLDVVYKLWDAPAGKKLALFYLLVPFAIIAFFTYYYSDMRQDISELRKTNKEQIGENSKTLAKLDTVYRLYIDEVNNCKDYILENDRIHQKNLDDYKAKTEKEVKSIQRDWRADYQAAMLRLEKAEATQKRVTDKVKP